jgi:hypothetical protein
MRIESQCQNCASYYVNWTPEVEREMEEAAPGEECSQGQMTWKETKCPGWCGTDED